MSGIVASNTQDFLCVVDILQRHDDVLKGGGYLSSVYGPELHSSSTGKTECMKPRSSAMGGNFSRKPFMTLIENLQVPRRNLVKLDYVKCEDAWYSVVMYSCV